MKKTDLLLGFLIGITTTLFGSYCYIEFFTDFSFISGIQILKSQGNLGKLITLGCILTIVVFVILLKINKDLMARGVVLSVIALAILTLFI